MPGNQLPLNEAMRMGSDYSSYLRSADRADRTMSESTAKKYKASITPPNIKEMQRRRKNAQINSKP